MGLSSGFYQWVLTTSPLSQLHWYTRSYLACPTPVLKNISPISPVDLSHLFLSCCMYDKYMANKIAIPIYTWVHFSNLLGHHYRFLALWDIHRIGSHELDLRNFSLCFRLQIDPCVRSVGWVLLKLSSIVSWLSRRWNLHLQRFSISQCIWLGSEMKLALLKLISPYFML
jgi:hypothetical protein